MQDNGTKEVKNGIWEDVVGGDGMECLIDYTDVNIQYAELQRGSIFRTTNLLVFDREGYSPDFFCDLWQERISMASYKKNVTNQWNDTEFSEHTGTLSFGTEKTIELAERGVLLQNKGSKKKILSPKKYSIQNFLKMKNLIMLKTQSLNQ